MSDKVPLYIQNLIKLDSIPSCQAYLRIMTDSLFDLIIALKGKEYLSALMAETSTWVQMMFTNTTTFSSILDGQPYNKGIYRLKPIVDHRMAFTIARTMYETLCAFELIYILPSNDDEKLLLYSLYEAAGYKEQLEVFSEEIKTDNPIAVTEIKNSLTDAITTAKATKFYQASDNQTKKSIDNALNSGNFRYLIQSDKTIKRVDWHEGMNILGVKPAIFDGMYKYFSNLAHPSHWGQRQYDQSFDNSNPEYISLICTATRFIISYLSIFIADIASILPEVRDVLNVQPYGNQQLIQLFNLKNNQE